MYIYICVHLCVCLCVFRLCWFVFACLGCMYAFEGVFKRDRKSTRKKDLMRETL